MDLHVRLWDCDKVVTRYLTSEFMGHATAVDMVEVFNKANEGLNRKSLLQLFMDGPDVNWKFPELVNSQLENDVNSVLLNVESCGLHIVHGALKRAQTQHTGKLISFSAVHTGF